MASTIFSYSLEAGRTKFPVSFEYLARRFVKVTLVGDTRLPLTLNVDYRFTSKMEIETTINHLQGTYRTIEIRRVTSATDRLVNFTDGSILRSQDLNIAQIQAIHIAEEGRDASDVSLQHNGLRWDAFRFPIKNVGNPTDDSDATNVRYVLTQIARTLRGANGEVISEIPSPASRANRMLSFNSQGQPVTTIPSSGSIAEFITDLANGTDPTKGAAIVGFSTTNVAQYLKSMGPFVSVKDERFRGGAKGDGVTDDYAAIQAAILYCHNNGGGRVFLPSGYYRSSYPIHNLSNVEVFGPAGGSAYVEFTNPTFAHGRGGFVMGSSREANREFALRAFENNTFPAAQTINPAYVNLALGQYLEDNPDRAEIRDASIHDLTLVSRWNTGSGWGGYGINFVNAWNCHAWNIYGDGWTQLFGMGSDVAPETPSNFMCTAHNSHVVKPDPVRTYYSYGFMANSSNCHFFNGFQHKPCTGTVEGNMVAANTCKNSTIQHMYCHDLGMIGSSTGVYVADCQNFFVDNISIGNARRVCQSFFFRADSISATAPIIFGKNISGRDCEVVVSIGTKFTHVFGFNAVRCVNEIEFYNSNVSGSTVHQKPDKIAFGAGWDQYQFLDNNYVKGWTPTDIYLRPAQILLNDKVDAQEWNVLPYRVVCKVDTKLSFSWAVPTNITAIRTIQAHTTFAGAAATKGTTIKLQVRRMVAFSGADANAPFIHHSVIGVPTADTTTQRLLSTDTKMVRLDDITNGLPNALEVFAEIDKPTSGTALREIRVRVYM